jgi:hypothetical protein
MQSSLSTKSVDMKNVQVKSEPVLFGMDEFSSLRCSYNYIFKHIEPTAEEKIQVSRYILDSLIRLNDNSLAVLEQSH